MENIKAVSQQNAYFGKLKVMMYAVCFVLVSFTSCAKDDDEMNTDNTGGSNDGKKAPAFQLKSVSGEDVSLANYNNKVVVLFFFGNACPSCKAAAPGIQTSLSDPFASNSNYAIIGIDQWDGNQASVEAFKSSTGVTFPLLLMGASTATAYSTTYDRLVVIDKKGIIVFKGTQNASNDVNAVKQKVEALLAN